MFKRIIHSVLDYLKKLNVYVATNEDTAEHRQNQIIATRLFLILFVISLISLVGYASLTLQLTTITLANPSQSTFETFSSIYPNTLVCPCLQTSIQVDKFIHVHVLYHQVSLLL